MAEKKPGRPPKKASEVRSRKIEVRLTEEEYRSLHKAIGKGISEWVRKQIAKGLSRLKK